MANKLPGTIFSACPTVREMIWQINYLAPYSRHHILRLPNRPGNDMANKLPGTIFSGSNFLPHLEKESQPLLEKK
jgi:hypothetical protein